MKRPFSKGNGGAVLVLPLHFFPIPMLPSYLPYHNLNQITSAQLAAPTMWPTSPLKAPPFEIGWRFSHGSCFQNQCSVFEHFREKSPLPLFPASSPLSPFLSSFFHHLTSFETQYHTLDSLCCRGKEHSFSGTATRSVRMQEVPWKAQKEQRPDRVRKCSNVATT